MLDLMRKHAKSWVINVIIAAIAVVFIFWGAGSFRNREITHVATVNGNPISVAEFQETYNNLLKRAQEQYRGLLNDEMLKALNLKNQALESLINQYLIFQQADALGIQIDDEALYREIFATPAFQVNGRFDKRQYKFILDRYRYSKSDYEQLVRRQLLAQRVAQMVSSLAKVSEAEALDFFHFLKDQVNVTFVMFPQELYSEQVKAADEDLKAYYDKNKEKYRKGAQVKAEFLAFKPINYESKVQVLDDEMEEYYEFNLDQYRQNEQVKARHILFMLDPNAPPEKVSEVRAKAEAVLGKAREPEADFAKLAEEFSEGPSAPKGGDLGWFEKEQMVGPFSEAAFAMKKGEISDLVRTDFGLHIIKVEDKKPAQTKAFEDVKDEIRHKMIVEKSEEMAADMAEQAYEAISLTQDFDKSTKDLGLTPEKTDFVSMESKPGEEFPAGFRELALSLKQDETSPLVDFSDGHYIVKAIERKEAYIPEMEEVRGDVLADYTREKAAELAKKAAEAFLAEAQKENNWDKAVEQLGATAFMEGDETTKAHPETGSTGPFTRNDTVPKIGGAQDIVEAAFSLAKVGQVAPAAFVGNGGYYVIRLKEKVPASTLDYEKEKENLIARLREGKGQTYFQDWLMRVRAKAEIEVEEGVF
jgi:peptidyl-prolyl cis-trans isomerase D